MRIQSEGSKLNILISIMYLGSVIVLAALLLFVWIVFTVPDALKTYSWSDILRITFLPFEFGSASIRREHQHQMKGHRKLSMILVSLVCTRIVISCVSWVILSFYPEVAIPELKAKKEGCLQSLNSTGLVGNCDVPSTSSH